MRSLSKIVFILIFNCYIFGAFFEHPDIDARGDSIGGAVTGIEADGNAVNNNPALLGTADSYIISFTEAPVSLGMANTIINQIIGHFVMPLNGYGGLGISFNGLFSQFRMDGVMKNLYNEYEISLGWGYQVNSLLQVGITGKMQTWNVGNGWGVDQVKAPATFNANAAVLIQPIEIVKIAAVGMNLIGMNIDSGTGAGAISQDSVPMSTKGGVSIESPYFLVHGDVEYFLDTGYMNIYGGLERYFFSDTFRLGIGGKSYNSEGFSPTLGFSVEMNQFNINYAMIYPLASIAPFGNHKITLAYSFGSMPSKANDKADYDYDAAAEYEEAESTEAAAEDEAVTEDTSTIESESE